MRLEGLNWVDEHCLLCGEAATNNAGHYHYKGKLITAGWCVKHFKFCCNDYYLPTKDCWVKGQGCFGEEGELTLLVDEIMREDERKRLLKEMGYE